MGQTPANSFTDAVRSWRRFSVAGPGTAYGYCFKLREIGCASVARVVISSPDYIFISSFQMLSMTLSFEAGSEPGDAHNFPARCSLQ